MGESRSSPGFIKAGFLKDTAFAFAQALFFIEKIYFDKDCQK